MIGQSTPNQHLLTLHGPAGGCRFSILCEESFWAHCLPEHQMCDGRADCSSGVDELMCGEKCSLCLFYHSSLNFSDTLTLSLSYYSSLDFSDTLTVSLSYHSSLDFSDTLSLLLQLPRIQ